MTNYVFADDYRLPGDPDDTLSFQRAFAASNEVGNDLRNNNLGALTGAANPTSTGNRV